VDQKPKFSPEGFDVVKDSMHNAKIGAALLDEMVKAGGKIDLMSWCPQAGPPLVARKRELKSSIASCISALPGRAGWCPTSTGHPAYFHPWPSWVNITWCTARISSRLVSLAGRMPNAWSMELMLDNLGFCRFHRAWAEDILPDVMEKLYGLRDDFLQKLKLTATRINSRNASIFWESERNVDFRVRFPEEKSGVEDGVDDEALHMHGSRHLKRISLKQGCNFWFEIHKGIHESLREFH
jgi:glyceraldehyde-3-phosphate dehydrogenase (ferredoxin)